MQVLMPSGEVTSDNVGVVCDVAHTNDIGLVVRNRVKRSSPRDCKKTGNWTGQDRKRTGLQLPVASFEISFALQLAKNINYERPIKDQLQLVATGLLTLVNRADVFD